MATTTTAETQPGLAPYAAPYIADLYGTVGALMNQEYVPYEGDRIAQMSPLQLQAAAAAASLGPSKYTAQGATAVNEALNAAKSFSPKVSSGKIDTSFLTPQTMQAAQTAYDPRSGLQTFQMGPVADVGTDRFIDQNYAQQYMSPYIQNVLDRQMLEAQRQADIATQSRNAQAVKAGAFGGARQAITDAEAARNLATQKADIEAAGLQNAYAQATKVYTSDAARALQSAMANQTTGYNVGAQNLAAQLGVQSLGAQQMTQIELANLAARTQAAQANLNAATQMQGLQTNAAIQQNAQNIQAQQAQGQLGLGALNTQANLAGQYGVLGAQDFNQQLSALNLQNTLGTQQQTQAQNILNQQYQDFQQQQQYPYQQATWASNILQNAPTGTTQTQTAPNPSWQQTAIGLGTALTGLAKGGAVRSHRSAGLADLMISKLG